MLKFITRTAWLFWCWIELGIFTLILYLLAWLPSALTRSYYHKLFRLWCRFFVRALDVDLRLHQKYQGNLPEQFILIANHPSAFEDVGIVALFNVKLLAKQGVRSWFLVGKINEAAGTLFVKRDSKESRNKAAEDLTALINKGHNVALFPEGGCKGRRIFETFQYGAFDISIKTGIPILPVFLHYEMQDTFEWRDPQTLIDKFWHFMTCQNNHANYYVYDPIDPKDFNEKVAYSEYVHNLYLEWQKRYLD